MSTVTLHVEDSAEEAQLLRQLVEEKAGGQLAIEHVETLSGAVERVGSGGVDVVLLDLDLPASHRQDSIRKLRETDPDVPIIALIRPEDERRATHVLETAEDYLVKGRLDGDSVLRSIRHAVERQRLVDRLKRTARSKSEFVATVSHELRTPISLIREFVSLVHDGTCGPLADGQKENLATALRNCDRLSELIEGIRDFARIESGEMRIRRSRTDLRAMIEACAHDFLPRCRTAGQELVLEIEPGLREALCDPDRIRQVLVNLLDNAQEFTPEGGTITIRARREAEELAVEVHDTGPGIRPQDQELIFDGIAAIDGRSGSASGGPGFGLAIARHIVHLHLGRIDVESAPGTGSCFRFTLPVHEDGTESWAFLEDEVRRSGSSESPPSVLLLDLDGTPTNGGDPRRALADLFEVARMQLPCSPEDCLLLESEGVVVAILSDPPSDRETLVRHLVEGLGPRLPDGLRIRHGWAAWDPSDGVDRWIDRAREDLVPLDAGAAQARRILVVDDDEGFLGMIELHLRQTFPDVEVECARDGYDACIRFGATSPDLVILDVIMPGLDGGGVMRSMRRISPEGAVRFLAISGSERALERLRGLGCDGALLKPFDLADMTDTVRRLLGGEDLAETVSEGRSDTRTP